MWCAVDSSSQALAKIAFLTGVFERLVAEAGSRRGRIEQMLAEINEERREQDADSASRGRAA
jgi:hypothetical protein